MLYTLDTRTNARRAFREGMLCGALIALVFMAGFASPWLLRADTVIRLQQEQNEIFTNLKDILP